MDAPAPSPLEHLDESWERALCIVAHPDDMEFGAAAAVARWTRQGKWLGYTMVTSGEAGIDGMSPDECRIVREAEQIHSARIVGVDDVSFLRSQTASWSTACRCVARSPPRCASIVPTSW